MEIQRLLAVIVELEKKAKEIQGQNADLAARIRDLDDAVKFEKKKVLNSAPQGPTEVREKWNWTLIDSI